MLVLIVVIRQGSTESKTFGWDIINNSWSVHKCLFLQMNREMNSILRRRFQRDNRVVWFSS